MSSVVTDDVSGLEKGTIEVPDETDTGVTGSAADAF